jgi:DNA-binding SARP family transcriptional activator
MIFAALLYLGVERGRRVPRAALQEMFFPNVDERSGSHSVRQLLYKLRQLGAPLAIDPSSVLIAESDVDDDSRLDTAFELNELEAGKASLGFLPDYEPHISERFSDWLDACRSSVSSQVRAALADMLSRKRASASWRDVNIVARHVLSLDPLNEEATLSLAEATAAAGSKQEALGLLSAYKRDTGIALHLAPDLIRKRISSVRDQKRSDALLAPLVGRSDEMAALFERLSHPARFSARLNVVVGEAGIGKSRLLNELTQACELAGMRLFVARCRSDHESRPLGVFFTFVPDLLRSRGALGVSPESLTQLRKLISAERFDGSSKAGDDDADRSEALRKALLDLVDAVAGEERLLLAIEDAHWCDPESLWELRSLAARIPSLGVIITTRTLTPLKHSCSEVASVFRLAPLTTAHMEELAKSFLPVRLHESRHWCVEVAAGSPLYLQMLCSQVLRTGSCTVPKDLTTLIASRLSMLPAIHLRALQYVALLGSNATVESLRELLGIEPNEFVACVADLEDQGYFSSPDERIRLTHDLVNDVALDLATPIARKALHAHVALFLEQRFDHTRDIATLWDCAEQWRLSGEPDKSVQLVRRCASHASALGQSHKALEILDRARGLTRDGHQLAHLLSDMMVAAKGAGQLNDVFTLHRELLALGPEQHSETELLGLEAEWLLNDSLDAERLLSCTLPGIGSAQHRLEACTLLQRFAHESCDEALATRAYSAVIDLLPSAPVRERLNLEIIYHATFGNALEAVRAANELISAIPTFPLVADRLSAARNVSTGLLIMGRSVEAIGVADKHRQIAQTLGLRTREYEFKGLLAACYLAVQNFEQASKWIGELEAAPDRRWLNLYRQLVIELAFANNDRATVARLIAELQSGQYDRVTRNRAFLRGAELRMRQLDRDYVCAPEEFAQLIALHDDTKRYISDDDFVFALAEDRRRRGLNGEGLSILDEYVTSSRRQCWLLPKSFEQLRSRLLQGLEIGATSIQLQSLANFG